MPTRPIFPAAFQTRHLGALKLVVWKSSPPGPRTVHRHYEPGAQPVSPWGSSLRVVVWPPERGVPDPTVLAAFVDRTWEAVFSRFDKICRAALPVLQKRLDDYFTGAPPDVVPPRPEDLLPRNELRMVKIDVTDHPVNNHVISFSIRKCKTIFHTDLEINLDPELTPVSIHFEG